MTKKKIVLIGDSIFDNGPYVPAGQTVSDHLNALLPENWQCLLLAKDGSEVSDIQDQLEHCPTDAGLIVVSAGGNDAIRHSSVLFRSCISMADALQQLDELQKAFAHEYEELIDDVASMKIPALACTIYHPPVEDKTTRKLLPVFLSLFNDVIVRSAMKVNIPVIDLREVCSRPAHFAHEIEPSAEGGKLVAAAISTKLVRDTR